MKSGYKTLLLAGLLATFKPSISMAAHATGTACAYNNIMYDNSTDGNPANAKMQTVAYSINPHDTAQPFEGWGVSLCWWANMCGKWPDSKIDEIVDWLVSPEGLNYRIFRYNIGGGEDPQNRHCDLHHMGKGKGLRAEMEGFKDSTNGAYHWERDAAQRKILLKIKEKRPDAIIEAFSNSCPYYMTFSGCVGGNSNPAADNLRPEYYEEFAHYLVDVCQHYKDSYGIEFDTLEPFNEAMSDYWGINGTQEGCHFDKESQVKFIRVLSPILKASGLRTVISASDETSVAQSVEALTHYRDEGVLPLIGQWNTHTYIADNASRQKLAALAAQCGIKLWMSEVGSGGKGIAGNLDLAQRLITDMRLLRPEAWVDWQYMEEKSDQWCTINGSFADATYKKVKNYYVRQQFSRFIREGYTILNTSCGQALAARSADGKTYVVVAINFSDEPITHNIDLTTIKGVKAKSIKAWRTSESEDVQSIRGYKLKKRHLIYEMPALSATTFVITL